MRVALSRLPPDAYSSPLAGRDIAFPDPFQIQTPFDCGSGVASCPWKTRSTRVVPEISAGVVDVVSPSILLGPSGMFEPLTLTGPVAQTITLAAYAMLLSLG
jgi:hypothetical protein